MIYLMYLYCIYIWLCRYILCWSTYGWVSPKFLITAVVADLIGFCSVLTALKTNSRAWKLLCTDSVKESSWLYIFFSHHYNIHPSGNKLNTRTAYFHSAGTHMENYIRPALLYSLSGAELNNVKAAEWILSPSPSVKATMWHVDGAFRSLSLFRQCMNREWGRREQKLKV